ncbi:hypothetical protein U0070_018594 [Myodes glareolus]|uniref:Uncharacterized protein n=1 Tax=Myodes glareolus TaxID=447135 RepID=A0AAW0ICM8_MYOGA
MTPVVLLFILCLGVRSHVSALDPSLDAEWEDWKILYEKSYSLVGILETVYKGPRVQVSSHSRVHRCPTTTTTTEEEEALRRTVWEKNMKMIKLHNGENGLGKNGYTMKMNAFGDMTDEEFKKMMVDFPMQSHERGKSIWKRSYYGGLPKFVDWREKGYVTPVRYQGNCSSCWAFAATGAIEGQMYKKTGKLIPLSVQNLVDCSKSHGNHGCDWGNAYYAFISVWIHGGLEAEATYPYEGKEGPCRYNPQNASAKIEGFVELPENEDVLMVAVASQGPIAAAIDALHDSFKFYSEGIYYEPNCSSWGESWGMNGYMKIAKDRNNHCGIVSFAQFPDV